MKHNLNISSGWKKPKVFTPALIVLPYRDSTNLRKVNNVKTKDAKKSFCAHKTVACSLYVLLYRGAVLNRHCILRNTTECLFLNLYYGQCELVLLILLLEHNREKGFYYFKHTVHIIQGSNQKNLKHTEADPKKTLCL